MIGYGRVRQQNVDYFYYVRQRRAHDWTSVHANRVLGSCTRGLDLNIRRHVCNVMKYD